MPGPHSAAPTETQVSRRRDVRVGNFTPSATGQIFRAIRGEENDAYPTVARLNDRWRVIRCRDDLQWILQKRRGGPDSWRGVYFFRTRAALVRFVHQAADPVGGDALVTLLRLPERFPAAATLDLRARWNPLDEGVR